MGWFKDLKEKIFKRKEGGTAVGNFFRGVASAATDGALGQGRDLARWTAAQRGGRATAADYAIQQRQLQDNVVFNTAQNAAFRPTAGVRADFQNAYRDRIVGKTGNAITRWLNAPLQGVNLLVTAALGYALYKFTNRNKK